MNITINDLDIRSSYSIFDLDTGHFIYSWMDTEEYDDFPFDVAFLPVVGLRAMDGVLIIDTRTGNVAP